MIIKNEVLCLIKEYKTNDPFKLMEALDIILVKTPLKGGLNGCFQEYFDQQIIYINSDLSDEQMRIVAAHELGHARLHRNLNALFLSDHTHFVHNKFEREANIFAAELLINDNVFKMYENNTLEFFSQCENISLELAYCKYSNFLKSKNL